MAQLKGVCCVLIVALMVCAELNEVASQDGTAKCCTEHYELGSCIPGKDDDPKKPGKCWAFCISGCEKGGFCKRTGDHRCSFRILTKLADPTNLYSRQASPQRRGKALFSKYLKGLYTQNLNSKSLVKRDGISVIPSHPSKMF
ncbi:hypothetical protein JCGZ_14843 [Jatropha curcas]|uniref:Knottin scorpion toxin-like domain-containing protein n=1 Tax=Jatropha curcas TaxID=180498 RepID=A0A067K9C3_JATCU|nr:hypothetical protein JCGZ_14843 [Jatropha curcas]